MNSVVSFRRDLLVRRQAEQGFAVLVAAERAAPAPDPCVTARLSPQTKAEGFLQAIMLRADACRPLLKSKRDLAAPLPRGISRDLVKRWVADNGALDSLIT
jgi:hypothetical protein